MWVSPTRVLGKNKRRLRAAAYSAPPLRTRRYLGALINHFSAVMFDAAIAVATGAHLFVFDAHSADGPPKAWCGLITVDYTQNTTRFICVF